MFVGAIDRVSSGDVPDLSPLAASPIVKGAREGVSGLANMFGFGFFASSTDSKVRRTRSKCSSSLALLLGLL